MSQRYHRKAVLGSFHQGHEKFGETRGIQCMMNSLISICYSLIKKLSCWKFWDLDAILNFGNESFQKLGLLRSIELSELPTTITLLDRDIGISFLQRYYGLLGDSAYFTSHSEMSSIETGSGFIFTTGGYSFAIIWDKSYFLLV